MNSLSNLPLELKFKICSFLPAYSIYNLSTLNKDYYYDLYNFFLKQNYNQSNILHKLILNNYPDKIIVRFHPFNINTRVKCNNTTINLKFDNLFSNTLANNKNEIEFEITTHSSIFTHSIFFDIKKIYYCRYSFGYISLTKK